MTHPLFRMGGLHASSNNQHTKAGQINEQIAYNMRGWDIDSSVKVALINIHILKCCKIFHVCKQRRAL